VDPMVVKTEDKKEDLAIQNRLGNIIFEIST
jgi:hypothetical protein